MDEETRDFEAWWLRHCEPEGRLTILESLTNMVRHDFALAVWSAALEHKAGKSEDCKHDGRRHDRGQNFDNIFEGEKMTEEQALKKWCPFAFPSAFNTSDHSCNRQGDGAPHPAAMCVGHACMAFRVVQTPGGRIGEKHAFCALAGGRHGQ